MSLKLFTVTKLKISISATFIGGGDKMRILDSGPEMRMVSIALHCPTEV